ncbi:MAG: polysaccharide biosynthesis protein [Eubacterium sp.]|jgi:stage V sporulation protein B|nr:polysaccharide biosynthesis protein [Eubacterium sp.]
MSVKKQIIKGTIVLTTATLISRVLGFLYRIFLSNLIGAKGMGIFQLIFPVLGFCIALSCGGIQIAVSRFVAESKNKANKFMILISSLIMSLMLSSLTTVCLYFYAQPISIHIIKNVQCYELLKYASITIPLATFHSCISGYYLGMKKTFVPAVSSIIEQIVKVASIFIIGLVCVGNHIKITPMIAVYSMIISESFGVIFCIIALTGEKSYSFKVKELFSSMKKLFSVSYILTINKIMITFLQCFEAILVPIVLTKSGLSSDNALSIYGILTGMALPVISFPSAINTSVSTMILPTIAGANTSGNKLQVRKTTEISIWFSVVMGIFFIGFFLYFGDFIGGTVFGHSQAGEYIKILAWLCPFMYLSITMGSILHGLGRTNAAFVHNVIGTAIRLACLWFVVPRVGIAGYLWGLLGSDLLITLLHGRYIKKDIHFSFDCVDNIIRPVIWVLCSMAAGWLVKYILSFSSFHGTVFRFISSGVSGLVLVGVFLYFLLRRMKELRTVQ